MSRTYAPAEADAFFCAEIGRPRVETRLADISTRGLFHVRNNRRIDRLWTLASQKVS
jgi:hypothetical protein